MLRKKTKTKYVVEWHLVLGIKDQAPSCIPKSGINYFSEVHFDCVSNFSVNSFLSFCDVCSDDCRAQHDSSIAPNNLIDSHHYKRHKKTRMTEFHSPSLSILIITQSKVSFLIILSYSKMIPRLVESFRNLHLLIQTRQKRRQLFS